MEPFNKFVRAIALAFIFVGSTFGATSFNGATVSAWNGATLSAWDGASGVVVGSYLLSEGFDGTGTPTGWSTAGTGTKDFDYTGVVLDGSQSLRVALTAQNGTVTSSTFTSQSTAYWFLALRFVSTLPGSGIVLARFLDTGGSAVGQLEMGSSSKLQVRDINGGSHAAQWGTAVSADTTYYIWMKYIAGSGANGQCAIAVSTTQTKPSDVSISNGANTTSVQSIKFGPAANTSYEIIVDKVRVNNVAIGDNPS